MKFCTLIIILLNIDISFAVTPINYQGHLWCGGTISGHISNSSGYEQYYSFTLDSSVGSFRFSTCGSHIETYIGIFDFDGNLKYFRSFTSCTESTQIHGTAGNTNESRYSPGIYYAKVGDPSYDGNTDGVYLLSLNCTTGTIPDFYYNNTIIPRDTMKSISCDDSIEIDHITPEPQFYEFWIASIVGINELTFNSVQFPVNVDDNCWKQSIYYLSRANNWTLITSNSTMKKGLFTLVREPVCDLTQYNKINTSTTMRMYCTFNPINSDIGWYRSDYYMVFMHDISCGLTVQGFANDGNSFTYQFVTNSDLQYVSFHTCARRDDIQNSIYLKEYKELNYEPYIEDKFGYWDLIKYSSMRSKRIEGGCNHLNWSMLSNQTHYLISISRAYWLEGDYTIHMECSDNAAVEQPINYTEYVHFESPPEDSKYREPAGDHVLLCDQMQIGYLHSFDSDEFYYAFKVNYYQYNIQFYTCYGDSHTTFDNVLYLYYFDRKWIKVNESHSNCNELRYYGVKPGYYYISINGYSSFEYGNFTVFMKCLNNDAIVFPDVSSDSLHWDPSTVIMSVVGAIIACLVICMIGYQRLRQRRTNRNVRNFNDVELQQSRENRQNRYDNFQTPKKPIKKSNNTNNSVNYNTVNNIKCNDNKKENKDDDSDDEMIKQQPTLSYSAMNCVICLDVLLENESCRLQCGHKFHTHCIEEYNETNSQCPLCRKTIVFN